jgi:hypothetical protein
LMRCVMRVIVTQRDWERLDEGLNHWLILPDL